MTFHELRQLKLDEEQIRRAEARERALVRMVFLTTLPLRAVYWMFVGLFSMRRLIMLMRETAHRLCAYRW